MPIRNRGYEIVAFWKFRLSIKWSWSVNGKRKYRKLVKSCAHTRNSYMSKTIPIFIKMGAFQSWCSCGWLSITPSFSQRFINHCKNSITYSRLHSIVLRPFPSLLLSMTLIPKVLKYSHNFCLHFKFWSSFIQLKIEKIIGYC